MAKKFTDLTAIASLSDDDVVAVVEDSSGLSKKYTMSQLVTYIESKMSIDLDEVGMLGTFGTDSDGNPLIDQTVLDIDTDFTIHTWESVGATGSGMDNEWAALDAVPTDVDWVELKFILQGSTAGTVSAGTYYVTINAREYGSTEANSNLNQVAQAADRAAQSNPYGSTAGYATVHVKIPVDGLRFDLRWTANFVTNTVLAYLTGYGYNA